MKRTLFAVTALLFALLSAGRAQTASSAPAPFPFVIPWDDATPGTATDVSFLNTRPAGAHGAIVVKGGHFVEAQTGRRVRFLGTNFVADAAFPTHADAEKVAARVAKLGINLVRLHHLDNNWSPGPGTIFDHSYKDRQHLSAAQLDKLDYLIGQFKKNGVYVNINLHVSRQFSEADGFPASVNAIPFGSDKRVDNYDRRMIQLQKDYARDLLTHVNPYTHLSYAQDPCVAVVEINNENSLVGDPWTVMGEGLDTLPEPFRGELVGFWNGWLAKKYPTVARLAAAWQQGVTPPGPSIVTRDSAWSLEHQGTSQAVLTTSGPDVPMANGDAAGNSARRAPAAQIVISQIDDTDWHVQAHLTGLDFQEGATYTVSFLAKADAPRSVALDTSLDQADWHNTGLNASVGLGTDWKAFHYLFIAHGTVPGHERIAFVLGKQTGTVWISALQIRPGAEGAGLTPGQSPAAGTVDMPLSSASTRPQWNDWLAFLSDTERAYADEMRAYLRNDLHVRANIIGSQIAWSGLAGLHREANMDFADNHDYWQHPSFPHKAWDPVDWRIENTSMVASLAAGGGNTLRDLAQYRVVGKPYSISEYNHPAPSDYQAETVPLLATFAAFQDWDMIYLFDYGSYGAGTENDKINSFFGIGSNPAKTAFLPAAAMIFRGQAFPKAAAHIWARPVPAMLTDGSKADAAWKQSGDRFFSARLGLLAAGAPEPATSGRTEATEATAAGTLQVTKAPSGGLYVADSPLSVAIAGFAGGRTVTTKAAIFSFAPFGNGYAALTLTPLDGRPLAQSRRMLLTVVGKVENQEMGWNADRTSVGSQWGHGPALAEGIPVSIRLIGTHPGHVYALDGTGAHTRAVPRSGAQYVLGPQYQTLWYEITP